VKANIPAETNSHAKWLRQVAEEARSGFPRFYSWANTCDEAADEIERLENIQRDFHNLDDVAEIERLRGRPSFRVSCPACQKVYTGTWDSSVCVSLRWIECDCGVRTKLTDDVSPIQQEKS
jgi:hypothetical protein